MKLLRTNATKKLQSFLKRRDDELVTEIKEIIRKSRGHQKNTKLTANEKETTEKLKEYAKKKNIPLIFNSSTPKKRGTSGSAVEKDPKLISRLKRDIENDEKALPIPKKHAKKLVKEKGKSVKLSGSKHNTLPSIISHELGHLDKGPYGKALVKIQEKTSAASKGKKGVIPAIQTYIGDTAKLLEEKRATREGLKILKKNGANKETLENAKKELSSGIETYKKARKIRTMRKLRD